MKPTRYLKIVSSSVVRNIQIDLKYKFLLITDIAWLVIDIFAFTLLGGMVDSATDVTYAMGVNVDVVDDTLEIYIYDVEGNYFYGTDANITIMEHIGKGNYDKMEGLKKYLNLSITINGKRIFECEGNKSEPFKHPGLTFDGKRFDLSLPEVDFLDNTSFENEVEIRYNHEGDDKDRIEKDTYFAYDSFFYLPEGASTDSFRIIVDATIDSVMKEEGLIIKVVDTEGNPLTNAFVYIDGEYTGETDEMGEISWKQKGDPMVHFRNKGT
ncbi:MAG: hypothetical protein KAU14_08255, partial [Thermoplasmata archaeon]|nr:hypothetical protein [Thermoplasmata archaeon]